MKGLMLEDLVEDSEGLILHTWGTVVILTFPQAPALLCSRFLIPPITDHRDECREDREDRAAVTVRLHSASESVMLCPIITGAGSLW